VPCAPFCALTARGVDEGSEPGETRVYRFLSKYHSFGVNRAGLLAIKGAFNLATFPAAYLAGCWHSSGLMWVSTKPDHDITMSE